MKNKKFSDEDYKVIQTINKFMPDPEYRSLLIGSQIGCGYLLCKFINEKFKMSDLDDLTNYAIAMNIGYLMNYLHPDMDNNSPMMFIMPIKIPGEHEEEYIFRKLKIVVENLNEYIKERESV
jgi:hypothetical protein